VFFIFIVFILFLFAAK